MARDRNRNPHVDSQFTRGDQYPKDWDDDARGDIFSEFAQDYRRHYQVELTRSHQGKLLVGATRVARRMPKYRVHDREWLAHSCPSLAQHALLGVNKHMCLWDTRFDKGQQDQDPDRVVFLLNSRVDDESYDLPVARFDGGIAAYKCNGTVRWFLIRYDFTSKNKLLVDDGLELVHRIVKAAADIDNGTSTRSGYTAFIHELDLSYRENELEARIVKWALAHLEASYGQGKLPAAPINKDAVE